MNLTKHAIKQASRRSVSADDIEYVLDHGMFGHQRGGRTFMFCGKDTERQSARNLAVVLADDGTVVTVVRTRDLRRLKSGGSFGNAFHVS
jgi:hypothetical protein